MKIYPTISRDVIRGRNVLAFDKIDGSNIRVEYSRKRGFYKFGSRNRLLGTDQPIIYSSMSIFREQWGDRLEEIFRERAIHQSVLFFEFHGEHSFAGTHDPLDNHSLYLLDITVNRKGFLKPKEYLKYFGGLQIAPLLFTGPCDFDFIESVKSSTLANMSLEGVVCKSSRGETFKIKSDAWLSKLRNYCGSNETLFTNLR